MTRILTFGYGSNMCFGRMKDRVPSLEFDAIGETVVQCEHSRVLPFPRKRRMLQPVVLVGEFEMKLSFRRRVCIIRVKRKLGQNWFR